MTANSSRETDWDNLLALRTLRGHAEELIAAGFKDCALRDVPALISGRVKQLSSQTVSSEERLAEQKKALVRATKTFQRTGRLCDDKWRTFVHNYGKEGRKETDPAQYDNAFLAQFLVSASAEGDDAVQVAYLLRRSELKEQREEPAKKRMTL
jgi:hypothetical protein